MEIVIAGNGAAGIAALTEFRRRDRGSVVHMVSGENRPAYSRVLLPYYLCGKVSAGQMALCDEQDYARMGVVCHFGNPVRRVDDQARKVILADGRTLNFDRLLIATGAAPLRPAIPGLAGPGVFTLWDWQDAAGLEPLMRPGGRLVAIGSGFVAIQGVWAAVQRKMSATVLEAAPRALPQALDDRAAALLARRMRTAGTDIFAGVAIERVDRSGQELSVVTNRGVFKADAILIGTGARPDLSFLTGAAVAADTGILVNDRMETSVPGIFAAGDAVRGPSSFCDLHVSHCLWPTAAEQGRIAGANLAGAELSYPGSLNMNVAEVFGLAVAAMGQSAAGDGCEVLIAGGEDRSGYLRIPFRGGVPLGAVYAGPPEHTDCVGLLRPLVRWGRRLESCPEARRRVAGLAAILDRK